MKKKTKRNEAIITLYKGGMIKAQIARRFRITRERVRQVINRDVDNSLANTIAKV